MLQAETDFLIAEFDALRREIELKIKEIAELWRYAILASGAMWAWLLRPPATWQGAIYPPVVYFLPFVLTLFLFLGSYLLRQEIIRTAKYIRALEQKVFCEPNSYGWETSLAKDRESPLKNWKHGQHELWENVLWVLLCLGNLALFVFIAFKHSPE